MRIRDRKCLAFSLFLFLFLVFAPSLAGAITVNVPGTDIVGELEIDWYEIMSEAYAPDCLIRGCHIGVSFSRTTGSDSIEAANLRWLQLVTTNAPSLADHAAEFVCFIDGIYDFLHHDLHDEPFYWARDDLQWTRNDAQFWFEDAPHADYCGYDFEWDVDSQFELYLVRQLDEAIQVLAKITWGYKLDTSDQVKLHRARLQRQNRPSQALEETLAEDFPSWTLVGASGEEGDGDASADEGGLGDGGGGGG
ncbi:MAG: hypothetical protein SWE60_11385 [Thermodesulfobacteriota bacterium]|nr:hypothetical protein [Thermodesulfobacteriota bacterium]